MVKYLSLFTSRVLLQVAADSKNPKGRRLHSVEEPFERPSVTLVSWSESSTPSRHCEVPVAAIVTQIDQ